MKHILSGMSATPDYNFLLKKLFGLLKITIASNNNNLVIFKNAPMYDDIAQGDTSDQSGHRPSLVIY